MATAAADATPQSLAVKKMSSKNYAYLGIYGDFDPDDMASLIGIEPSQSEAKHSKVIRGRKLPQASVLRLGQKHAEVIDGFVDVYKLTEDVYLELRDHTKDISNAIKSKDASAVLQVVLDFPISDEVSTPAIGFSREVIEFANDVGASIDIDTYRA